MSTGYERIAADREADIRREAAGYQGGDEARQETARGVTILAGALMVLAGLWALLTGIAAVVKGSFFVATPNYLYNIDTTSWGGIHIGLGVLLLAVGFCLFAQMTWARIVGIGLVTISAVMNFLFIPRYPFWSIVMVALDVIIIWALATSTKRTAR